MIEILNQFLFGDPEVHKAIAPAVIAGIAAAAPGVIKAVGSAIGGGKRRREERAAQQALDLQRQQYETFDFKDPSRNLTNPFEDLTVNQQAAQFASQQQQQALAGTLGQLRGAAGSSGIAALAQSLANQQSRNLQAASANIAQQEQANQIARAKGQQMLERARAAGEQYVQGQQLRRTQTLLGMEQQRLGAVKAARAQATADLVGGVGEAAGAILSGIANAKGAGSGGSGGSSGGGTLGGTVGVQNYVNSQNTGGQLSSIEIPEVKFP